MIKFNKVSFHYANAEKGSLNNVSLQIKAGECVLLCGKSGCGKTTLTRLINGLIPHYYEGELSGEISVNGVDIKNAELYDMAKQVGSVFQNPRSQFFCVDTTGEIAFGCENLGLPADEIDTRVITSVEELNAKHLLGRSIFNLSGGEKQKIACASVSAMSPTVFVLDEPTSNLDTEAICDLTKILQLWKSQGKTIVLAEHRLYWLKELCDRVIYLDEGKIEKDIPMTEFCTYTPEMLADLGLRALDLKTMTAPSAVPLSKNTVRFENYRYTYPNTNCHAVNISELTLPQGSITAVVGKNGAGKSTLSKCLCGLTKHNKGTCQLGDSAFTASKFSKKSYMVMQDVNHQLFCESVEEELLLGMTEENESVLEQVMSVLELTPLRERHPLSLSGGQKQRVAIASAVLAQKQFLVFDEPTSGLDFYHMERTAELIKSLGEQHTVLIITHDPELIVRCCNYVVHMERGSVKEQGPLMGSGGEYLHHFFRKEERINNNEKK